MRTSTRISLALVTSAAMVGLAALPASAADGDGTVPSAAPDSTAASATIEVEGGILSISLAGNVAADAPLKPGTTAKIAIPAFTVTDERAGIEGWAVGVTMTDFTSDNAADLDAIIPVAEASYTASEPVSSGTATVAAPGGIFGAGGQVNALAATGVKGNNTATWTSLLSVDVPSDALAGTYTGTLTHSVI